MKHYQPLLLEAFRLRAGPFRIRRLRLHRHLDETSGAAPHDHPYAQLLVYLTGQGEQRTATGGHPVRSGTAALFPPHRPHAFRRSGNRRPLCLVVDFDLRGAGRLGEWIGPLPQADLAAVRHALSGLIQLRGAARAAAELREAALVLEIVHRVLPAAGWTPRPEAAKTAVPEVARRARRVLAGPEARREPVGALARRIGYQKDHLNRMLRRAEGMTLGQLRAALRLDEAKRALLQGKPVGAAAAALGWDDANYFTRWFRKQTGLAPRAWRERNRRP